MRSLSPAERLSTDPAAAGSRRYRSGQSLLCADLPAGTALQIPRFRYGRCRGARWHRRSCGYGSSRASSSNICVSIATSRTSSQQSIFPSPFQSMLVCESRKSRRKPINAPPYTAYHDKKDTIPRRRKEEKAFRQGGSCLYSLYGFSAEKTRPHAVRARIFCRIPPRTACISAFSSRGGF